MNNDLSNESKIIPLNIILSYPVHWGKYQIIRDFVQNFYDATTPEQWKELFQYNYDKKSSRLFMEICNEGFSYEWLLHIGASTKTEDETVHAGYFGEGFKIASLCALRDFNWKITMYSREWKLEVLTISQEIDGKTVEMLAFSISSVNKLHGSRLEIQNFTEDDYNLFLTVQNSFYFPQNDMFGQKIWESDIGAVYERSKKPIHIGLPNTYEYGRKGAIFCAYQMLGTNPFPLVFCLHNYDRLDRERKCLHEFEVNEVILKIAVNVTPEAAVIILEKMHLFWNNYPKKKSSVEVKGWSPIINALVRRIRCSKNAIELFRKNNPNLLCASRVYSTSDKIRRHQALAWALRERTGYKIVKDTFCLLGYSFLEDECEKDCGFAESERLPKEIEKQCFEIMECLAKEIFYDFFDFNDVWPTVRIITNSEAICKGMATLNKRKIIETNYLGLKIRYNLKYIHLKKQLFHKERFSEALSTYVHELCHVFGGDSSGNFSIALTYAIEILLKHYEEIEEAKDKWIEVLCNEKVEADNE